MSTEPPRALGNKIDTLLGHLLDDGFHARMDTLYVPWKMHAQQAALLDWKRPAGTATTGLIQHNRATSASQTLYMNGNAVGTNTYPNASRALPTRTVYLAAENGNGTLIGKGATKLGAWWMGDDFTPAEQTAMKGYFDAYAA